MNYFEFYGGDYTRDTAHLSLAEHGAFVLLLTAYYSTEKPLPADLGAVQRIARAVTVDEQRAASAVAEEFFPVGEDGLRHNARADREIEKARKRIDTARVNGSRGGRRPSGIAKPNPAGNPVGSDPVTQRQPDGQALHTPYTNTKEQEQKHSSSGDDQKVAALDARLSEVARDAIETWNGSELVAGGLASIRPAVGFDKRKAQVRRMLQTAREICLAETGTQTITRQFWVTLWDLYAQDDFYAGRGQTGRGHDNWKPDFEFLTRPATVLKLYDKTVEASHAV